MINLLFQHYQNFLMMYKMLTNHNLLFKLPTNVFNAVKSAISFVPGYPTIPASKASLALSTPFYISASYDVKKVSVVVIVKYFE